jgi:hypothetical protein
MFSVATTSGLCEWRTAGRLSTWPEDCLRKVTFVGLGCAVSMGLFPRRPAAAALTMAAPHPVPPGQAGTYSEHARRRLAARLPVTGRWQVSGQPDLTRYKSMRHVPSRPSALDLQTSGKTIAVMPGPGPISDGVEAA